VRIDKTAAVRWSGKRAIHGGRLVGRRIGGCEIGLQLEYTHGGDSGRYEMLSESRSAASPAAQDGVERRRSRRRTTPGLLVAIETPERAPESCWVGTGLDINGDGLGIALPPDVEVGDEVVLTFHLGAADVRRVPGVVLRQEAAYGVGAIRFRAWPDDERLTLLGYLLER
jgi:hypothetical protein